MSDDDNELLQGALELAARGLKVVPAAPRGKIPSLLGSGWQHKATTDVDTIRGWWNAHHEANVGIAVGPGSGVVIIDCDDSKCEKWVCEKIFGNEPPAAPKFRSPGGAKFVFRYSDSLPAKANLPIKIGREQIGDLKIGYGGKGSFVVMPPSIHPTGSRYAWEPGCSLDDIDPPEFSERAIAAIAALGIEGNLDEPSPNITEGYRDNELTRYAGGICRDIENLSDANSLAAGREKLHSINETRCEPPLERWQVEKCWQSVLERERKSDRRKSDGTFQMDPFSEACALINPLTGERSKAPWRLVLVDSDPPAYKLFGPPFEFPPDQDWPIEVKGPWLGFLLIDDSDDITRPRNIVDLAVRLGIYLDPLAFKRFWNGAPASKKGDRRPGAIEKLMQTKTREQPPVEAVRKFVLAAKLLWLIGMAQEADEPHEQGQFIRVGNQLWCRHDVILGQLNCDGGDKIARKELISLFEEIRSRVVKKRIGLSRHQTRFRVLGTEAEETLANLAIAGAEQSEAPYKGEFSRSTITKNPKHSASAPQGYLAQCERRGIV